jgi:diguanylate cyclase (GGDEF)-like protein
MIKALLIGDDLAMVEKSWRSTTEPIEVRTMRARCIADASFHLRHCRFDVVLANLTGPDGKQIEVIRDLHRQLESTPIVVMSDSDDPDFAFQAVQQGAQDVMASATTSPDALQRTIATSIERKRLELDRLRHARVDRLTGVANHLLLEERFERAVARADRQATLVALVAIDLDQPAALTGHHGADALGRLMPLIAARLMSEIRETDTLARTRDAGFAWLVEGLAAVSDLGVLVDRLPTLLAAPFMLGEDEVLVTVSVGVAVFPFHGRSFPTLLKMAEAAMLDVVTLNGDGLLMPPLPAASERDRSAALV